MFHYPGLMPVDPSQPQQQPQLAPGDQLTPPGLQPAVNQPMPPPIPVPQNMDQAMAGLGETNRRVQEAAKFKGQADLDAQKTMPGRLHAQGLPTEGESLQWSQDEMAANEAAKAQRMAKVQSDAQLLRAETLRYADLRPQSVFERAPTWGKVAMGIAMIAGGALSGYSNPRGGNPFLKAIDDIIEQDLGHQEKDIERKGKILDFRLTQNRQDKADTEEEFTQAELSRAKKWELVKQQLDLAAKTPTSEQAQADMQLASAQAEQKIVESYLAAAEKREQLRVQRQNAQTAAWAEIQGQKSRERQHAQDILMDATTNATDADYKAKALAAKGGGDDATMINGFTTKDGQPIHAPRWTIAAEINEKNAAAADLIRGVGELAEMRKEYGAEFSTWTSDIKKIAKSKQEYLYNRLSDAMGQGVVRKEDYASYSKIFGSPQGIIDNLPNLQALSEELEQKINSEIHYRAKGSPDVDTSSLRWWETPAQRQVKKNQEMERKTLGMEPF